MKKHVKLVLLIILLVGFCLRIYKISSLPMYGDELTMVYDSYSLLKTGKDQLGKPFPITFEMGAGRPAGYVYFSIPFVALFGPGLWGVRSLSLLSGIGIVILIYLLGKKLFNQRIGLIGSALAAVNPWELSLSRGGFEAHFALFLMLLATTLFIFAKEKPKLYLFSALSLGLVLLTYPTYKLTLPLFLLVLFWYSGGAKKMFTDKAKRYLLIALGIGVVLSALAYSQTFYTISEQRFLNLNLFAKEDLKESIIEQVNYERVIDIGPLITTQLLHNRPLEYFQTFVTSYFSNFSVDFLFLSGDEAPRHNAMESGYFYWVEAITIVIGIAMLWQKNRKELGLLVYWLLIAPLATSLLLETHGLRNSMMFPPLVLLSAAGLNRLLEEKKKRKLYLVLIFGTLQMILLLERMYFVSPQKFARFWSYPAYLASEIAQEKKEKYDYVVLSDEIDNIEYAFPAYAKIHPNKVINQQGKSPKLFGNVYIGMPSELSGRVFWIEQYNELETYPLDVEVIGSTDMTRALVVYETQ